jgi:hypothetical protein
MFAQEIVEEAGPIAEAAAKIGGTLRPVNLIAGANVDPLDLRAPFTHGRRKLMQQWPRGALKEEEGSPLRLVNLSAWSLWTPVARREGRTQQQQTEISGRLVHWTRLLKRRMSLPCSRRMPTMKPA